MRTKSNEKYYCKFCKKDITHKPSNRRSFCNLDCFSKWVKFSGSKRKRVILLCKQCHRQFESKPAEKRVFCSRECQNIWNSEDKKINNYKSRTEEFKNKIKKAYKDGKLIGLQKGILLAKSKIRHEEERSCRICNKKFIAPINSKKKFCSLVCAYKRPGMGGYHEGSVTNFKSGWYESPIAGRVWLDSSYEFIMARYLDEKKYKWTKNKIGFDYAWKDDRIHLYFPDFYVQDLDIWIETKGYMVERDTWKWYFFPYDLKIITKKKIFNPEIWGF